MIKSNFEKLGMFATPESDESLQRYVESHNGEQKALAYTIMGMTWNRAVDKIDELEHDDVEISLEPDSERSIWITVGNISVYVRRTDEGAVVDMYTRGDECSDDAHLAGCYSFFAEAQAAIEELCNEDTV